jgi:integrase
MLNLSKQIHAKTEHWRSSLMYRIGGQVSPRLTERCSDVRDGANNSPSTEQDNYKRLSAFRLLSPGGLYSSLIEDIKKTLLTRPAVVLENGTPKRYGKGRLCMKGRVWTKEKCPICNKSFSPAVDELTGDYLDLKCPDHHTRPRYVYIDARQFKVDRIYSDKRGLKFDSFLMAHRQLEAMRKTMDDHEFDPDDWSPKRLKEYNFKALALGWLIRLEKERSHAHYRHCNTEMTLHIIPLFRTFDVRDVKTRHVEDLYDALIDKGLAPKSIKNCLGTLKIFLNRMYYKEIITELPKFRRFEVLPVKQKGWIGKEKQLVIISQAPEHLKLLLETACETADRPQEIVAHKKKDLVLMEGECAIVTERSFDSAGREKIEKSGKQEIKGISRPLWERLQEHSKDSLPEAWLFVNDQGNPYRQDYISGEWKKAGRKVGIHITLYNGTRHSKASRLKKEMEIQIAREIGHTDVKTTKKHYILGRDKEL